MKKLVVPFLMLIASCNQNNTQIVPQKEQQVQSAPAVDNSPQLFFSTSKSCSESTIEILSNSDGTFTLKETRAGVSTEMKMQKEALVVDGKPNVSSGEVKLKGSESSCLIAAGKCDEGTHRIALNTGDRVVECCGSYAE
jgi:hypothetical protein